MAPVSAEDMKGRGTSTTMGVTLFVKAVRAPHFKMHCNKYGTTKQEADLLRFVPFFRPSGHVNLCAPPIPPPHNRNPKEPNIFSGIFGDLWYMDYQKHVKEYIMSLKTIILKHHSRAIEKGHTVRRLAEVRLCLRTSVCITRHDSVTKKDFRLTVLWWLYPPTGVTLRYFTFATPCVYVFRMVE
jgi:hypothetical protein